MIRELLTHPLARGVDLDSPQTGALKKRILQEKKFLKHIYEEWYGEIVSALPPIRGPVLELGSGPGFLRDYLPEAITSDVVVFPDLSVVLDAHRMPFKTDSLRAVVMIDVLHHLCDSRLFFQEAARCVTTGGAIIMVEPWVSAWSRFMYKNFHHEPFDPDTPQWEFKSSGPFSGANGALPWMIFHRDISIFEREFPQWRIKQIKLTMPFSYVISGGITIRAMAPARMYRIIRKFEDSLHAWMNKLAMFAFIVLEKSAKSA
jgi:SAM-dependent methyltransferase